MLQRIFGPGSKENNDLSSSSKKENVPKKEGSLQNNPKVNDKFDYCYVTPRIIVTGRPTSREVCIICIIPTIGFKRREWFVLLLFGLLFLATLPLCRPTVLFLYLDSHPSLLRIRSSFIYFFHL